MITTRIIRFWVTSLGVILALVGCSKSNNETLDGQNANAEKLKEGHRQSRNNDHIDHAASGAMEDGSREAVRPTATERDMALKLGNQLLMAGKLEEAEAKYKIAAAAGSAEADRMLGKIRMELSAKAKFKAAREKMELGDYEGAKAELRKIPSASSIREMANRLEISIDEKREAMNQALEAGLKQGLAEDDQSGEGENGGGV